MRSFSHPQKHKRNSTAFVGAIAEPNAGIHTAGFHRRRRHARTSRCTGWALFFILNTSAHTILSHYWGKYMNSTRYSITHEAKAVAHPRFQKTRTKKKKGSIRYSVTLADFYYVDVSMRSLCNTDYCRRQSFFQVLLFLLLTAQRATPWRCRIMRTVLPLSQMRNTAAHFLLISFIFQK